MPDFSFCLPSLAATGWTIDQLRQAQKWVKHTHEVIAGCKELLLVCVDCETRQRGYIATGDRTFLDPLNKSRAQVTLLADKLTGMVSDDPSERLRMQAVGKYAKNKLDFIDKVISTYERTPRNLSL